MRRGVLLVMLLAACSGTSPAQPERIDAAQRDAAAAPAPAPAPVALVPCIDDEPEDLPAPDDAMTLIETGFAELPGWADDRHAEAIPPLLASCARIAELKDDEPVGADGVSGKARSWRRACAGAARVPAGDHAAARAFFEAEFTAYAAHGEAGPEGKFTGYYVETLRGSRRRHGAFQIPIHGRPADLVSVDLTRFFDDARGRRVWGRLDGGALVPYLTRAEIRAGALDGQGLELLYVDDPVDAVFMHIEGSGKVEMDDGSTVWLEFAGKNGRSYRGVGKLLRDLGELKKGEGTMQGIRAWFAANPHRTDEIIDRNSSYVFFAESKQPGAVGTQKVVLTPRRSLAVDRAFVAFGTPIWVDTEAPVPGEKGDRPWRHLLIAQDTGGGILGPVRGDIYWGADADAADLGGRMGGPGRWWLLLPRSVKVRR
jgi:membrane-bound lytic murein transglycosylase A